MIAQQGITKSVIDGPLRFPHGFDMLTHDEIREELIRQIDAGLIKQAAVARALHIAPARVAEMRKGERRVQPSEMPRLAEILGLAERGQSLGKPIEQTAKIPHLGKVAQGVWLEQSFFDPASDEHETVPYDRMAGDPASEQLFAVTPEGSSMNQEFKPGTRLICRRVAFGDASLRPGDYVIAERTAHDLHELTCKRLEIDEDGAYWLHSESDDDRYKEPWRIGRPDEDYHGDVEIRVVAKVIRAVKSYE